MTGTAHRDEAERIAATYVRPDWRLDAAYLIEQALLTADREAYARAIEEAAGVAAECFSVATDPGVIQLGKHLVAAIRLSDTNSSEKK